MSNYPSPGQQPGQPAFGAPQQGYPPQQPPRSGCGGCLGKFLIALGVLFALLIAVCCGGFFYFKSWAANAVTQDPAEVQKISDEVISVQVPAPLEPVGGGRFKMPIAGTYIGEGVVYADKNQKGSLILASFGDDYAQLQDSMLQALSGQGQNQSAAKNDKTEQLKDAKKTRLEPTIQGEKALFEISEGIGVQSGKQKIRVQGAFKGKSGKAIFVLDAEEDTIPREKVDEMIDSIK
jgi:hypothetical protein